ncbi:Endoribonuclease [Actinidia chinensis var. chinensis]|uniref:Endoribonuclease n=1 Tax=Actinidia chinensis var. chinensis TaxID=1590841 RepID=A0A2R6QYV3_ACTCC|nr:Endoribonuclease [Actinidia chinensis var. chinensis]
MHGVYDESRGLVGGWMRCEVSCRRRVKTKVVGCATEPIKAWAHQIEIWNTLSEVRNNQLKVLEHHRSQIKLRTGQSEPGLSRSRSETTNWRSSNTGKVKSRGRRRVRNLRRGWPEFVVPKGGTTTQIDLGELTDLRLASVNNDNFAHAAVKRDLHQHLQHCSGFLLGQITEYVKSVADSQATKPFQSVNAPKAVGDVVESITGAILIDTKLNLDYVWRIFKPLLSPIVTPDKLELPHLRELIELSDSLGYFIKETCIKNEGMVHAELRLQLKDVLLGEGFGHNRKSAKGQAAVHLLKDLENRRISSSKRRKQGPDRVGVPCTQTWVTIASAK